MQRVNMVLHCLYNIKTFTILFWMGFSKKTPSIGLMMSGRAPSLSPCVGKNSLLCCFLFFIYPLACQVNCRLLNFSSASIFKVLQCCSNLVKMLSECQTTWELIGVSFGSKLFASQVTDTMKGVPFTII